MTGNSFAIYQLKNGQEYHMLRFASLADLDRDAKRLLRDVHAAVDAAEGVPFPDKAAVEAYFRDAGFEVLPNDDTGWMTVSNLTRQEAAIPLMFEKDRCRLKGGEAIQIDQRIRREHYDLIYTGNLPDTGAEDASSVLEGLYARFNLEPPEDFHGHSLSVSDVIVLTRHGETVSYYTDSIGFTRLPDFTSPENPLRNAELAQEDDCNMIDGLINNGPKQEHEPPKDAAQTTEQRPEKHKFRKNEKER